MSIANQQTLDFWLNWGRLYRMNIRKWEFITEVTLSLLITALALQGDVGYETAMIMIGIVHSFNVARAIEAYKSAQVDTDYQSKLD